MVGMQVAEGKNAKAAKAKKGPVDMVEWVLESGLFDAAFYAAHHGYSFGTEEESARHYAEEGSNFSCKPNLFFDPAYYLQRAGDVSLTAQQALRHFAERGDATGVRPSPVFDNRWYRQAYRLAPGANSLAHYLRHRRGGRHSPLPEFDVAYYLEHNPDVKAAGIDPFEHFLLTGYREGRKPSTDFDLDYHSQLYFGVPPTRAPANPLLEHLSRRLDVPAAAVASPMAAPGPEFLLAGDSNYFALGAPVKYQGARGLIAGTVHGRRGHYVMEENSADRSPAYWDLVAESSRGRDLILSWRGNQHITWFLFEPQPLFDFIEPAVRNGAALRDGAVVVPRRLLKAFFQPSFEPLAVLLGNARQNGAESVTVVGTPPPRSDLALFEKLIRPSPFWRQMAQGCGLDLDTAQLTRPLLLLKLWAVLQEMLAETAVRGGARFVPVPDSLRDPDGFLPGMYGLDTDFTHANEAFGSRMMQLALEPGGEE